MRRAFVGMLFLVLSGCGRTENQKCSDVFCPGEGRGQCVDLKTDPDNCGSCGRECDNGEACEYGRCFGCAGAETQCGTVCVDLESSESHCGACWADCSSGEECIAGECHRPKLCGDRECAQEEVCIEGACVDQSVCDEGQTQCGQKCFDLQTDARHCGSCTNVCPSGLECAEGACACPAEMIDCWFGCLDPSSDPLNCGACGALCENSTFCEAGVCRCPDGLTSCDGTCVDTITSRFHCGACGVECNQDESCFQGSCQAPPSDSLCSAVPVEVGIQRVALYQGVELDLIAAGAPVAPSDRPVDVIRGRDALVRVFVTPTANFEPTTLVASVLFEGAEESAFKSVPTEVTRASNSAALGSTLNIFVPGESITEGIEYSVQLSACQPQITGEIGAVRIPTSGTTSLAARRSGELVVRFIPVVHDGHVPDTSSEVLDLYAREVMRQYPAKGLRWDLGEPLVSDQAGILPDLGLILDQVTERRANDNPPENVYYYGLVDPAADLSEYCDGGCTTGIAWWLSTLNDWAVAHRTGVGIGFGTYGANTFAHELGHNLGRDHAPCNTEGDANYPYPGASIGVWGYDPVGGILKDPADFADLMSYCEPNWVSDYTYKSIFQRLAATEASLERGTPNGRAAAQAQSQTWASFIVTKQGVKWTRTHTRSGAPSDDPEKGVVYDIDGAPIAEVEVHRIFMADGGGYKVFVPERGPGWFAVGLADGIALPYK